MQNKKGRIAIILGLLLIAAALCLAGYNIWEDNHAHEENMSVISELEQLIPTPSPTASPTQGNAPIPSIPPQTEIPTPRPTMPNDHELNPDVPMPKKNVKGTDYIGILEIPTLGLKLSVASETTRANLKRSPCRHTGSVYTNDLTIAAHNFSYFFGSIRSLHIGAEVRFTDLNGNVFVYHVSEVEILAAEQRIELTNNNPQNLEGSTAWDLTLFTCNKPDNRFRNVVRCVRVG